MACLWRRPYDTWPPGVSTSPSVYPTVGRFGTATPYVMPGQAGYLGSLGALTAYSPTGSGYPGAGNVLPGATWESDGMHLATTNLVLDHVAIYGAIYFTGLNATVTNSVMYGGTGSEFSVFSARGATPGTLTFSDCTLGWVAGATPNPATDTGVIWDTNGSVYMIDHCDISGSPQGLGPISGAGSQITYCVIAVAQNNQVTPSHMDCIFNEGAADTLVEGCWLDADGQQATAALFWQAGSTIPGCVVTGNYLKGGAITLHNEDATGLVVTDNVFTQGFFGDAANTAPGTIGTWAANVHTDGTPVPSP